MGVAGSPILRHIRQDAPKRVKLGLLAGTLSNLIGTYWLIGTLSRFGGFPIPVSVIFIVILSAFSGLSYALFSYIVTRLGFMRRPGLLSALLVAAVWTSIEYFFPFLFPYGIGNSQADYIPVVQIFDLFGVYALSFIIVLVNVAITRAIMRARRLAVPCREAALSAVLVAAAIAYGYVRITGRWTPSSSRPQAQDRHGAGQLRLPRKVRKPGRYSHRKAYRDVARTFGRRSHNLARNGDTGVVPHGYQLTSRLETPSACPTWKGNTSS
ncbi:MAG: hypothetical protein R3B51_07255 [Thermodesulfobacteriota bacterium]